MNLHRTCDGMKRRDMLKAGVLTAGGLTLANYTRMAQAGQLLALDDYAASLGWNDRILPVFLELGRYDGALYALPKTTASKTPFSFSLRRSPYSGRTSGSRSALLEGR